MEGRLHTLTRTLGPQNGGAHTLGGVGSGSVSTPAATRNENRCYRSPTRSAMAQMARHPSVHMTDITPAHTAATLRPDRHHTHGHQVAILGWRLYEAYRLRSFLSFTARPGRAVGKLRQYRHAHARGPCRDCFGVAWACPGRAVDAQKGGASERATACKLTR